MLIPGLTSKVKALYSKILNQSDYHNLIEASSITEIVAYLKNNTHYNEVLVGTDIANLHRRDVEILIRKSILSDFYHLYFYLPVKVQKLFKLIERRYEIENIKFIFRSLHSGHLEYISKERLFPVNHKTISEETFMAIKNFDDALNTFKNSIYSGVITSAYDNYRKTQKLQYLLNAIDFWYFSSLESEFKKNPEFSSNLRDLFFKQVDLINIQWIYRARLLFKLSTSEVLNLLLPITFKLSKSEIENLSTSEDLNDFIEKISLTFYGEYFKNIDQNIFSYIIERLCNRILLKDAKELISETQNGLTVMSGYLFLREYEYKDLITLIEAKRYKIPNDRFNAFLLLIEE